MKTIDFTRTMVLDRAAIRADARTVPAVLSTEAPVSREFGEEVLLHTSDAVDMTRAAAGLPLLFSHDRDTIIGRVENIHLDGKKLRGLLRFSTNQKADEVFEDVKAEILTDLSIGYQILDMEPTPDGSAWHATRWMPHECSVVTIPADPAAGINRSAPSYQKDNTMKTSLQEIREIVDVGHFDAATAQQITLDCVKRELSAKEVATLVMDRAAQRSDALDIRSGCDERVGDTSPNGRRDLMAEALAARCGGPAPSDRAREFVRLSTVDMARACLDARGVNANRLSPSEVIVRALTTSDFPELLLGAGNRTLAAAYQSYRGGIKRIARQSTIADFRAKQVLKLGEAPSLDKVNEHGEYKYGAPAEAKESYQLATYGRIFGITRQALINDDLGAFGQMAAKFGVAAAEREAVTLAALLTANPTMGDGIALFHADHDNLAAAPAAINVTSLGLARKAMRLQTGLDGVTAIDVTPAFLIVPAALETVAEQFLATLAPTVATDTNPFSGKLELVVDPRLDGSSATAWYLAARPDLVDTIEYAYLEGFSGPTLEVRDGWEVDGTEFKARLDFGAGILDHRGLFKNAGA